MTVRRIGRVSILYQDINFMQGRTGYLWLEVRMGVYGG